MKQLWPGLGVSISALLLVSTLGVAEAQRAPDAATVASWVNSFYGQTQFLTATFEQRYVNRVYQSTTHSTGRIRLRRPGMLRFDYDDPNGKIVASDGQTLVVYEPPGQGQQRGQYYQQNIADAQLPDALGFLTGSADMGRDYRHRLLDAARLGGYSGQVLELRPRRPSPHYTRIVLFVDDRPNRRGAIDRILIVDHSNNRNRFDLSHQERTPIRESVFRYRPPRGARRVEPGSATP